jgi:hypothetical protein
LYQGLGPLGVDDFVYIDGKKRRHEDVLAFWSKVREEGKAPYDANELRPYEPHGYREVEDDGGTGEVS